MEIFVAFGGIFATFSNHYYVFSILKYYRNSPLK